jgi:bacterioferritin-associated ferredoxin
MVTRCVCHKISFDEIKLKMEESGVRSFEDGLAKGWYGSSCGMCHDYIRKMISTGQTSFRAGDIYIENRSGQNSNSVNKPAIL